MKIGYISRIDYMSLIQTFEFYYFKKHTIPPKLATLARMVYSKSSVGTTFGLRSVLMQPALLETATIVSGIRSLVIITQVL